MLGVIGLLCGSKAVTQSVAFVYPAFQTIKAVRTKKKEDDTFWLCYWVMYGAVNVVDSILPFTSFIPMFE